METERPSSSRSIASLQSDIVPYESDAEHGEVVRSPSVASWHHQTFTSHEVDESKQEWLHRIHSEPLLDNLESPSLKGKNQHRSQSAGVRKVLLPRFGAKTNVVHPTFLDDVGESDGIKSTETKAWNEFISQDSDSHSTSIVKTPSSPNLVISSSVSEPRFRTPSPRFGSARARVAPAPEGYLETEKALKRLNTALKQRKSATGLEYIGEENDATDSRQDTSPSPVSSYNSRPTSRTSLLGRKRSASKMRDKPSSPADIFKTHSHYRGADAAQSSKQSRKEDQPSGSSHSDSVVSIEESTGEKIVTSAAGVVSVEHQPYIPLETAQHALANFVDDMHKMKIKHIQIVDEIEAAYRDIEDESKLQYKNYVQNLRKQHDSKMAVYKQVVKLLQDEIDKMKEYWEGTTTSLASRNRELLFENKTLYDQLKNELQQMERDKEKLVSKFTRRIEKERKRKEQELQKARQEIDEINAKCSDLVKTTETNASAQLSQERDTYNQTLAELQKQLADKQVELEELIKKQTAAEESRQREHELLVKRTSELQAISVSKPDKEQLQEVPQERAPVPPSSTVDSSRKMKTAVKEARKELDSVRVQLHSMLGLFDAEPNLREAFQQTLEDAKERVTVLQEERNEVEKQIVDWKTNFQQTSEREPTEDDWDDALIDSKSKLESINSDIVTIEQRIATLNSVQASFGLEVEARVSSRPISSTKRVVFLDEADTKSINEEADEEQNVKLTKYVDQEFKEQHSVDDVIHDQVETEIADKQDDEVDDEVHDETTGEDYLEEEEVKSETEVSDFTEVQESKEVTKDEASEKPTAVKREQSKKITKQSKSSPTGKANDPKQQDHIKKELIRLKKQGQADQARIKALEKELKEAPAKSGGGGGASVEERRELKKKEKELKDLKRLNETANKTIEKIQGHLKSNQTELTSLKKENEKLLGDATKSKEDLEKLSKAAKDGIEAAERLKALEIEVKKQAAELKTTIDNYNSERILRKKYYNLIEDMKGKIRVYCRVRPLSGTERARNNFSVIESPDEYTLNVRTQKKLKEFQFDQVFTEEHSQEKIFEDSKNLIQSAVDGYNVCIFAYGQTGSGKTYTMIGGKDANNRITAPGIAPRAFATIFELIEANRKKYDFAISCYMLELYNDRLLDLFQTSHQNLPRLEIKKDKKGMVVIHGAVTHDTDTAEGLMELFENGSKNRHIASTKMNAESSRSHLIIGVVIESTNLANGTVHRGKLSLVDLAGSERASKTGATAEQLKEAQSINKSLSALGDVISALSSGQDFIPYRNNKLTMLMQDSLGGNAKTLMFVNISPADYNADETVVSLTYAARVKLITNDASKNADNKEIARLKAIITQLRKGETVGDDEV